MKAGSVGQLRQRAWRAVWGFALTALIGVSAVNAEKKWAGIHEGGLVTALAVDPAEPDRVYAATARGLFASADAGVHWKPLSTGLPGHFVGALAIEPDSRARSTWERMRAGWCAGRRV